MNLQDLPDMTDALKDVQQWEDSKYGYDKDGNSLNPKDKKKKKAKRWWDDDGDGKGYEKGEVDGKFKTKKEDVDIVERLIESGNFSTEEIIKITNLQETDIADIIARLEKKRISKGGDAKDSPLPAMREYHSKKKKVKKEHHEKDADGNVIEHEVEEETDA